MLVLEYKLVLTKKQAAAMDEAIRTVNFIRNKCLRLWKDGEKVGKYDLSGYCVPLSKEYEWAGKLNSQARQAAAERTWSSIAHFYDACKHPTPGEKPPYPRFKKRGRSVEYKTTGWKLSEDRRHITFTDGFCVGRTKLLDKRPLSAYPLESIKRVRVVKRADGYYCQFVTNLERVEPQKPTGTTVGIDVGLRHFYTDSEGRTVACPKFYRKAEKRLKRANRRLHKKKKGSANRGKARQRLARQHLKVARQRNDFAAKAASALVRSNDLVAYEDLQVRNMVKNRSRAKSISDASWSAFLQWVRYYGKVFGKVAVAVPAAYTSQDCSACGRRVPKDAGETVHRCPCGCVLDRDLNAALNILKRALHLLSEMDGTGGHLETGEARLPNAWGDGTSTLGAIPEQVLSLNQEPHTV